MRILHVFLLPSLRTQLHLVEERLRILVIVLSKSSIHNPVGQARIPYEMLVDFWPFVWWVLAGLQVINSDKQEPRRTRSRVMESENASAMHSYGLLIPLLTTGAPSDRIRGFVAGEGLRIPCHISGVGTRAL